MNSFTNINKSLDNACGLWLKQPMPNRQYVLMTDANFKNAGYALMIEQNAEEKITSVRKTYATVAFSSKIFSRSQIKMSIYAKEILAIYFAFMEYSHILWESTKPFVILTDNKSVTRLFQTKIIPPALWNACDFVLQFHFTIAPRTRQNEHSCGLSVPPRPPAKRQGQPYHKGRHTHYTYPGKLSSRPKLQKKSNSASCSMTIRKQKSKSGSVSSTLARNSLPKLTPLPLQAKRLQKQRAVTKKSPYLKRKYS